MSTPQVRLQCVKQGSKLRVRIISPGYNPTANCQFPRAIRVENAQYLAPASAITFSEGAGSKFFYRVAKSQITQVPPDTATATESLLALKVFGSDEPEDCAICMSEPKDTVFAPCGHYNCFHTCATIVVRSSGARCPICRAGITQIVHRDRFE